MISTHRCALLASVISGHGIHIDGFPTNHVGCSKGGGGGVDSVCRAGVRTTFAVLRRLSGHSHASCRTDSYLSEQLRPRL